MRSRLLIVLILLQCSLFAVIIDRVAIVIGNSIIKDSDIDRDLRATAFLNGAALDVSIAARKKVCSHLIDQVFIRQEIRVGDYRPATMQEAAAQLDALKKQRFKSDVAYRRELDRYGLTELDLRSQFQWQLTVLHFVDVRFRPAVLVSDEEIERYYREHRAALQHDHPGKASLEDLRTDIQDILTGEKVNLLFFAWLDEQRRDSKIRFLEEGLA